MTYLRRTLGVVCGTLVVACLLACGGMQKAMKEAADRQKRQNDLMQIGIAMQNYHDTNQTFPADQQAFVAFLQKSDPGTASIVQSGQYTILYAPVKIPQITEGTSNVVMGYDNTVGSDGRRLVLLANASVELMTDGDFNAKKRLNALKK
jgi:hypothetical protein